MSARHALVSLIFFVALPLSAAKVTTTITATGPFGTLNVASFDGTEGLSSLFHFDVEVTTDAAHPIGFDRTIGALVDVALTRGSESRHFIGICSRISESATSRDLTYRLEIVPRLVRLAHTRNSRIFQNKNVPEILRQVLQSHGIDFQLNLTVNYQPRNYVVQYRESDFAFLSRLMEEEGIFYFFRHSAGGHQMIIGDSPAASPAIGSAAFGDGVTAWQKSQELTAGKVTLFDHNFELPHNHLDATKTVAGSNSGLEAFDFPGGYAKRFDGVGPGGGEQPSELQKIFNDATRTANLRAEEIAAAATTVDGAGSLAQFSAGSTFTLAGHPTSNGQYLVTGVRHTYTGSKADYQNTFTSIPAATPFRPPRRTPRPEIGPQTAYVVGPAGEETFTDKYSRIKVQFHWDREGKKDENSSCWIRVDQLHHPEIGDEVLVVFLEGDPDQPIIVGTLWNPERMPPPR